MKASVYYEYGSPDVLHIKEVEKPEPQDNEVLVKVHAAAVTAVDNTFRKGDSFFAKLFTGRSKPKFPTLGSDFAGVVEAVGTDVQDFKPGDEVFGPTAEGHGAHAEYICLPQDSAFVRKPAGISYEEAAALSYGSLTALPFLRDTAKLQQGQGILINGASGSIGTMAVQLAKQLGAEVTGVCGASNVELVKSLGADHVIDYRREDFTVNGKTYDVVFDTVGKSSFAQSKRVLKPGGIYMTTVIGGPILFQMLRTSILGSKKANITFTGLRRPHEKRKDLLLFKELAEHGKLKAVIDTNYPFERIIDAHRHVDKGHKSGGVVVTFTPQPR